MVTHLPTCKSPFAPPCFFGREEFILSWPFINAANCNIDFLSLSFITYCHPDMSSYIHVSVFCTSRLSIFFFPIFVHTQSAISLPLEGNLADKWMSSTASNFLPLIIDKPYRHTNHHAYVSVCTGVFTLMQKHVHRKTGNQTWVLECRIRKKISLSDYTKQKMILWLKNIIWVDYVPAKTLDFIFVSECKYL